VFIFQIGAALTTATSTSIVLTGAAQACNVFWQVATSATLGTTNAFVGTITALTSITVNTGTTVAGRALARNGAVTLDDNVFTNPSCATTPTTTTVTATPSATGGSSTLTATVAASGANAPTGTVTFSSNGAPVGTSTIGATGVATLTVPAGTTAVTQTITAHYNGLLSYGASTSAPTNLVITAAPTAAAPSVGPADTTPTLGSPDATVSTLPDTGPAHTLLLSLLAVVLLLAGSALTVAGRRSPNAPRHLKIDLR